MILLASNVGENELMILGGDLNRHVRKDANSYDRIHAGFGYGVRNLKTDRILEMGSAIDIIDCLDMIAICFSRNVTLNS